MKKLLFIFFLLIIQIGTAQKKWFTTYKDSVALVKDANAITNKFTKDLKKIDTTFKFEIKTILNTTPYLIFFIKMRPN